MSASAPSAPPAPPRPRSRPTALLVGLVAAAIAVSGCLLALALVFLRTQAIESGERLMESLVLVIEEQTTRTAQAIDQRMELAAHMLHHLDEVGALDTDAARQSLLAQQAALPLLSSLRLYDPAGQVLYASDAPTQAGAADAATGTGTGTGTGSPAAGTVHAGAPASHAGEGFRFTAPARADGVGGWRMRATRPVPAHEGGPALTMVAEIDPLHFDRLWRTIVPGPDGSIALWRRDGTLIMRSPLDTQAMARNFGDAAFFSSRLPAQASGSFQDAGLIDGKVRLFAYRTLAAQPDLVVVVGQSLQTVLAPWRRLAAVAIAVWLAAAVAVVLLSALLQRVWRQRQREHQHVQHLNQRLSLAVTVANMSVWDWDLKNNQWYATPSYFTMLGYDPAEGFVDTEKWLARVHPDDRAAVAASIEEALSAGQQPYHYEARMRHADGGYRWINVMGRVLERDASGKASRLLGVTRDVTEQKEAELALRNSEAHYRELFRNNPHPMWIFDLHTRAFLDVNDAAVQHYGYGRDEFLAMTVDDIRPAEDVAKLHAHLELVRQGRSADETLWRHRRKDGSIIVVETASHALVYAGRAARFIHAHDVTERRAALERLRASEENLSITLQSIGDAVIATDAQGRVTRMNPTAERMTGWPLTEALGQALDVVFHIVNSRTREVAVNPAHLVMQHGNVVGLANHTALIRRDGHEYQISDSAAPIRDPGGAIVGVVLVFSDVTEQYRVTAALRESEARLQATLNALPDLLFEVGLDGRYHRFHTPRGELLAVPPGEFLGKTVAQVLPPQAAETVLAALREAHAQGHSDDRQLVFDMPQGRRWFELSVARKQALPGEDTRFIVLSRDVTSRVRAQAALADSEQRFRTLVEWTPDAVAVHQEGRLVYVNPAAVRLFGATAQSDLVGRPALDFVHPHDRPAVARRMAATMTDGAVAPLREETCLRLDGSPIEVEAQGTGIRFDGKPAIQVVLRDISERKLAQQRALASAQALRDAALHTQTILDNMADCVITITPQGVVESFNKAACTVFGYAPEEVVGLNVSVLMPEPYRSRHDGYLKHHMDSGELRILGVPREVEGLRKDGSVFPMSLVVSRIARAGQTTFIGIVRDITQHRRDVEEIRRLAFYDLLTGLPNRRLLMDRLRQAMVTSARAGHHGALMFLDLDHFKALNDTLGHDLGDVLLQQVARRLQSCVREGDSVARLGGDEFVVLLEGLSLHANEAANQAELVASKVLDVFSEPFALRAHAYETTPSIGITVFIGDSDSIDDLLKKADVAMYQAKSAGRNTARFFDPAMQAVVVAHEAMERDLRRGLAASEFVLHYQVQVDRAGQPVGAEALVRWNHCTHGMLSPGQFIALAEQTGLIRPLGQWVLETACAQLLCWADDPQTARWTMAVNVSASQFAQADFVAQVDAVLRKTGADPQLLKLELTESTLVEDVEAVIAKMNALKAFGVGFSLDDFGTGYSSLSYLKRLPLDQLKIDRSFVRDVLTDPSDAVIARTIVALGHSLGLQVIAEGVETAEQHAFLAQAGCDAFQGYRFGRPGAASALATPAIA